jgi:hypothetical protein
MRTAKISELKAKLSAHIRARPQIPCARPSDESETFLNDSMLVA